MKKKITIFPLLIFLFFLSGEITRGIDRTNEITLLNSNKSGLTFEVNIPFFKIKDRMSVQGIFQMVEIPGFGQTSEVGKPLLPIKGTLIEIPPTGDVEIKVLETSTEVYSNYYISPCPKYEIKDENSIIYMEEKPALDHTFYTTSRFYPSSIAELGFTGFIRNRRVAQLKIYPFQYNPLTKVLLHNKRIVLQVLFEHPTARVESMFSDPYFDRMLREVILNFDEKAFVNSTKVVSLRASSFHLTSRPSNYKIPVNETGIYKITYSDLTDAEISPDLIDARTFKIFCQGQEIAIYVSSQGATFGDSDFILFYGKALNTEYTESNIYWLSWGGAYGKRMNEVDGTPNSASLLEDYFRKDHFEENHEYWITMPNGEGKDCWFWERINAGETKSYSFDLNRPASTAFPGVVKVTVFGRTSIGQYPDHHIKLYLNGSYLGEGYFDGHTEYECIVSVDQSLLNQGTNTLQVELVNDTGSPNSIYLNYFTVEYHDDFVASENFLSFDISEPGYKKIQIDNFSQDSVEIFDITDHDNVKRIVNSVAGNTGFFKRSQMAQSSFRTTFRRNFRARALERKQTAQGSSKVTFAGNFMGNEKFIALVENAKKSSSIKALSSSTISGDREVNYIIITHEDFYNEANFLANYRRKGDFDVRVVKVGDIYDRFNHGIEDPQAIKDFLIFAYQNWGMPSYVLFLGDATVDPHDYMGTGRENFIPTYFFNTSSLRSLSDNWFVCISGEDDVLPDYFAGRLTVKSAEEARGILHKIKVHEQFLGSHRRRNRSSLDNKSGENLGRKRFFRFSPSVLKRALFIADNGSSSFTELNDELAEGYFSSDFTKIKVYLENYTNVDDGTTEIINSINQGVLTVNFVGHGSYDNWCGENLFLSSDVDSLNNLKFPFVLTLTCLNGYFASWPRELWGRYIDDCLAEKFVNASNKGAIASCASSSLGYTWEHGLMAKALFSSVFNQGNVILGDFTTLAKINAYAQGATSELVQTFILFGDPACSLAPLEGE